MRLPDGCSGASVCCECVHALVEVAPRNQDGKGGCCTAMPVVYDPSRFWGVVMTRVGSVIPLVFLRSVGFLVVPVGFCMYVLCCFRN